MIAATVRICEDARVKCQVCDDSAMHQCSDDYTNSLANATVDDAVTSAAAEIYASCIFISRLLSGKQPLCLLVIDSSCLQCNCTTNTWETCNLSEMQQCIDNYMS
jgi:hypothetical protein